MEMEKEIIKLFLEKVEKLNEKERQVIINAIEFMGKIIFKV